MAAQNVHTRSNPWRSSEKSRYPVSASTIRMTAHPKNATIPCAQKFPLPWSVRPTSDQTAAHHAIELARTRGQAAYALVGDLRDGLRGAHRGRGLARLGGLGRRRSSDLSDGAELLALGAAAHPAQRRRTAGVALVGDARLGHVGRLRAHSDSRRSSRSPGEKVHPVAPFDRRTGRRLTADRRGGERGPGARRRGHCAAPLHGPGSTPPGRRRPSCP